ncbi:MAG: UDP-N-acetylmuramoyl-L-alanyl-D-glutamate--2,6-diaminopimelate ligase [Pseudomonadota bacterium]
MRLGALVPDLAAAHADIEILGITADSRAVTPGTIFAALQGSRVDGARFVPDALAAGAVAILCSPDAGIEAPVIVRDADPRRRLALIAAALAGPQPETIVAVTGTAGKTSVAEFARQIFAASGHKAVSLGTLGIRGALEVKGGLTTPDPVALHERLAALAAEGIDHVAMEASSHGLDQRRLDGVELCAAAFTNIGRDHLDYHPTPGAYLEAKLRLFTELLPEGAPTVVDPYTPGGAAVLKVAGKPLTVGRDGDLIRLEKVQATPAGSAMTVACSAGTFEIDLPLIGAFQVDNALVSAGLAIAGGLGEEAALGALAALKGAPGRLELVGRARGAPVFVDYAHKPEAVTAALQAVRPGVTGRLMVVIGAGGDRDPGKRPLMGQAAAEAADVVIVTDDNPRSEDPQKIRAAILAAAPGAQEIGDRAEAIAAAVEMLKEGDALVVAGKGHEEGQIVGDTVLPFNDRDAVRQALNAL